MRKALVPAVILLVAVLAAYLWWPPVPNEAMATEVPAEGEMHEGHSEDELAEHHDDEHEGHDDEEQGLQLTAEQRQGFGIAVELAGAGLLRHEVSLPGEIVFDDDRVSHLDARVSGIALRVTKTVGDPVTAGELLTVIDSRELADTKAEYLAAQAREGLAVSVHARERTLWEKQISSEQDFLRAQQVLAEAQIERRSAEQKLHALGLSDAMVEGLDDEAAEAITLYEIRSPIRGIVTERDVDRGQSLDGGDHMFTIVNTDTVWANLTVYTKNLPVVREGQAVVLRSEHSGAMARGEVAMVTPFVEESTRSAAARVVLDNRDARWVPGTFVTGSIEVHEDDSPVVIPRDAVQHIDGRDVVFVEHLGSFEMTAVKTGRTDRGNIEILGGLAPGTPYVAAGAFELKATVVTRGLGSHAGHGH